MYFKSAKFHYQHTANPLTVVRAAPCGLQCRVFFVVFGRGACTLPGKLRDKKRRALYQKDMPTVQLIKFLKKADVKVRFIH